MKNLIGKKVKIVTGKNDKRNVFRHNLARGTEAVIVNVINENVIEYAVDGLRKDGTTLLQYVTRQDFTLIK